MNEILSTWKLIDFCEKAMIYQAFIFKKSNVQSSTSSGK